DEDDRVSVRERVGQAARDRRRRAAHADRPHQPRLRRVRRAARLRATGLMSSLARVVLVGGVVCGALVLAGVAGSGSVRPLRYVALGDSFSAGEGVPPFRKGTNRYLPPRNRCHRSYRAYPALVAGRRSSPGIWGFWACSGARLRDLT